MAEKLNALGVGYVSGILSAAGMLLLGVLGNFGIYTEAVEMMQAWHVFFSLTIIGIIAGMVEAAIICFIFGYAFGWLYNKFV